MMAETIIIPNSQNSHEIIYVDLVAYGYYIKKI